MPERPKGPPSLRLSGPRTNALVPISSGVLASTASTRNTTIDRFLGKDLPHQDQDDRLADFKAAGQMELERRAKEEAKATFERRVNELMDQMDGQFRLKLATVLDYTASTIKDVIHFVSEIEKLVTGFRVDFSQIDFLPIAVSGPANEVIIQVGQINNFKFYNSIKNQSYKLESPIGAGVIEAVRRKFFTDSEKQINGIVTISDQFYEIFPDHDMSMQKLQQGKVALASLTSACKESHIEALSALGELGIVVDRSRSEMDPVDLIREFILNQKTNTLRRAAIEAAKREMAGKKIDISTITHQSIGLGERLKMMGFANEARNVIQGGVRTAGALKA